MSVLEAHEMQEPVQVEDVEDEGDMVLDAFSGLWFVEKSVEPWNQRKTI